MKNISFSTIALWLIVAVTVILTGLFFFGEWVDVPDSTGKVVSTSAATELYINWCSGVVVAGVVILIIMALKSTGIMFQQDAKAAATTISFFVLFFAILAIFYFTSGEQGFSRVVNGETETFDDQTVKMIDMWIKSIIFFIGASVVLILAGPIMKSKVRK